MILTITGKLGSGKTYYVVNYLIEKYFLWKEDIFQYVPRNNLKIVSNIDDLAINHVDLNSEIERVGLSGVFNKSYVERDGNTIFIIDEAQNIFHRKFFDKDIFYFFQTSRHYGVDVLLITQDVESLCKEIKILQEYEIRAEDRSRRTKNMFVYRYISGDDVFRRKLIRFDLKKAMLYRSRIMEESEKVPNTWARYVVVGVVLLVVAGLAVRFAFKAMWGSGSVQAPGSSENVFLSEQDLPGVRPSGIDVNELVKFEDVENGENGLFGGGVIQDSHESFAENSIKNSINFKSRRYNMGSDSFESEGSDDFPGDEYVPRPKTIVEFQKLPQEFVDRGVVASLSCSNNLCIVER